MKETWKKLSPYFVDIWQYLVIIVIMIFCGDFYSVSEANCCNWYPEKYKVF